MSDGAPRARGRIAVLAAAPLVALSVAALACGSSHARSRRPSMHVTLAVEKHPIHDARNLAATATLTNDGARPVRLNALFLPFPSLVLEVRDAAGRRVPLGPPPVPPEDDGERERRTLAPGQSLTLPYRGIVASTLPRGRYTIRFRFEATSEPPAHDWQGVLESPWVEFTIE